MTSGLQQLLRRAGAWLQLFLLLVASVLLISAPAKAAIVKVQTLTFTAQGNGTSTTASFPATPAVGDTIVVYVWSWGGNSVPGSAITVTDNFANTYTSLPQISTSGNGNIGYQDAAVLSTIVTASGSAFAITATTARNGGGYASQIDAVAIEYSGLAGVDLKNAVTGTSATASISLGGTTAYNNEVVAAIVSVLGPAVNFNSITPSGTGTWTTEGVYTNNSGFAAGQMSDQTFTTAVDPTITWTAGSSSFNAWAAAIVSFNPVINCTSIASGNWSSPSTWTNCNLGIPIAGYTATIASGTTVTLDVSTPVLTTVTVNAGGTLTATAANTLNVGRIAGASIINNGTIALGAFGSIALGNNLSFSGSGTWSVDNISVGNYTLNATALPSTSTVGVNGNLTIGSGAFQSGSATWNFTGSGAQSISGGLTFGSLAVNNTGSGVTLSGSVTVSTALTLTGGYITTGGNDLIYSPNCSTSPISVTNGYVFGTVSLTFPTGAVSCTFPVGDSVSYAPITVAFTASKGGTLLGTTATDTGYTEETAAGFTNNQVNVMRYWTLTKGTTGGVTFTGSYSATPQWGDPADLEPLAVASTFFAKFLTGGTWTTPASSTPTNTSLTASGMTGTGFGILVVGSNTPPGTQTASSATFNVVDGYYTSSTYSPSSANYIFTKLAGVSFTLDVLAISTPGNILTDYVVSPNTKTVQVSFYDSTASACSISNCSASACSAPIATTPASPISVPFTSTNKGFVTGLSVTIPKAYMKVTARVTDSNSTPAVSACSTDVFSVRPPIFTVQPTTNGTTPLALSSAGPTGSPTVVAGSDFTISATASNIAGTTAIAGYSGTPLVSLTNSALAYDLVSTKPLQAYFSGVFSPASATTGVAIGTTFQYSDVGYFVFNQGAVYDSIWTGADAVAGPPAHTDCVVGSDSNILANGMYGCNVDNHTGTSGGRFIPAYFGTTIIPQICPTPSLLTPPLCPASTASPSGPSFTYSGQPFPTTVTAYNTGGGITANYTTASGYAKTVSLAAYANAGNTLPAAGGTLNYSALTFAAGIATLTPNYQFSTIKTPPAMIWVGASEPATADGVSSSTIEGSTYIESGRTVIVNAYGSPSAPLPMTAWLQYWSSANSWALVTNDGVTTFNAGVNPGVSSGSVTAANYLPAGWGTVSTSPQLTTGIGFYRSSTSLFNGTANFILAAPNASGRVDLSLGANMPTWLNAAQGRATFGIYAGSPNVMYLREIY